MDKAPAYGAGDCGFESHRGLFSRFFLFIFFWFSDKKTKKIKNVSNILRKLKKKWVGEGKGKKAKV